jgi:FkbM family methyltransferase
MADSLTAILRKFRQRSLAYTFKYAAAELKSRFLRTIGASYSQRGEDLIISKALGNKRKGFYVDVGAFDPFILSNTLKFYKRGWGGINIEPQRERYASFVKNRQRDINLNIGIGKKEGVMDFFEMVQPVLSTFSKSEAKENQKLGYKLKGVSKIKVCHLSRVLSSHVGKKKIDFMTIDAEGFDLNVLESNDWKRFRPTLICVESNKNPQAQEEFLNKKGYTRIFYNGLNSIFKLA